MVEFAVDYDRSDSESDSLHSAIDIDNERESNMVDSSEPPAWMQAFMQTQQQLLEQNRRETEQRIDALAAQIQNLRTSANTPISEAPTINLVPPEQIPRKPRPVLPDPEPFDGEDLTLYPQFRAKLRAKLSVDASTFGGNFDKLWYGFSRLEGKAAARILPWMTTYEETTMFNLPKFWDQLDSAFRDRAAKRKAIAKLNRLRQGKKSFDDLLRTMDQLLLESGGHEWADEVKKGYLSNALNIGLKDRLVAVEEADTYEGYCRQVKTIADRMEDLRYVKNTLNNPTSYRDKEVGGSPPQDAPPSADTMDWEPTTSKTGRRRAEWVDDEEMAKRKTEKRCLRCGKPGHFIRQCRFLAPEQGQTRGKKDILKRDTKTLAVKKKGEPLSDSESSDEGEQEKE